MVLNRKVEVLVADFEIGSVKGHLFITFIRWFPKPNKFPKPKGLLWDISFFISMVI